MEKTKKSKKEKLKDKTVKNKGKISSKEKGSKEKRKKVKRSAIDKVNQRFSNIGKTGVNIDKVEYLVRITDTQSVLTLQGQLLSQDPAGIVLRHKKGRGSILRISRIPSTDLISVSGLVGEGCIAQVRRSQIIAEFHGTVEVSKSGKTLTCTDSTTEEKTTVYLNDGRFNVEVYVDEGSGRKRVKKDGKKESKKSKKDTSDTGEDDFDD